MRIGVDTAESIIGPPEGNTEIIRHGYGGPARSLDVSAGEHAGSVGGPSAQGETPIEPLIGVMESADHTPIDKTRGRDGPTQPGLDTGSTRVPGASSHAGGASEGQTGSTAKTISSEGADAVSPPRDATGPDD